MDAVSRHLPPAAQTRPAGPRDVAFESSAGNVSRITRPTQDSLIFSQRVFQVLTAAGWAPPRLDNLDLDLDVAAGRGLEQAVFSRPQIGAVGGWLRGQPAGVDGGRQR